MGQVHITRSVDEQTKTRLKQLGQITRRNEGKLIDWLVDEAWKRFVDPGQLLQELDGPDK